MNNLSELIMRRPPSPQIRHQAEAWARQAYGMIQRAQEMPLPRRTWFGSNTEQSREVCDQVLGVVLFNLGMLREVRDFSLVVWRWVADFLLRVIDGRRPRDSTKTVRAEPEAV